MATWNYIIGCPRHLAEGTTKRIDKSPFLICYLAVDVLNEVVWAVISLSLWLVHLSFMWNVWTGPAAPPRTYTKSAIILGTIGGILQS